MKSDEIEMELRGLRALVAQLDAEVKTAWEKTDEYSELNSCFLRALLKKYSQAEILGMMRDAEVSDAKVKDMAQYFSENDFD